MLYPEKTNYANTDVLACLIEADKDLQKRRLAHKIEKAITSVIGDTVVPRSMLNCIAGPFYQTKNYAFRLTTTDDFSLVVLETRESDDGCIRYEEISFETFLEVADEADKEALIRRLRDQVWFLEKLLETKSDQESED